MTIYKFQQVGKKSKEDEQPETVKEPLTAEKEKDPEASKLPKAIHVTFIPRRSKTCINMSLMFISLIVLSGGAIGGIYLYGHLKHTVIRGRCGVIYTQDLFMQKDPPVPIASGFRYNDQNPSKNDMSVSFFEETIEITDDYYERVEIPKFDECENAIVLHDFERNFTAIVDKDIGRCFIMKLNRSVIAPPKDLWDLLHKLKSGYYMPRATVVRETYSVEIPALDNLSILGPYVRSECSRFTTFMLRKIINQRLKRSAESLSNSEHYGFADHKQRLWKLKVFFP
ncbi:ITM2B [Acanthosepion pharaonis]|uniref:Integral membrane protein 2 n=1 Tax=Acanthosepion pharaonis TaxID=158019 RepID=A0A812C811_ACAPH|nr:ITM2B [Sepia pharaonis]